MPTIDISDEVFLAVAPAAVAPCVADRAAWRRWWPDLVLRVDEERGVKGVRWSVSGPLTGSMELWLEPVLDGTVLHYFLRAEPAAGARRSAAAETRHRRLAARALAFELRDRLDSGRAPGCPPGLVSNEER
ncbi:polyketide cyclase / dehydrase and lipid transport [Saccharopolyspora taberi]|uniref:Polyketide cyclase / dehydrase and lipid transport n=1 Tax=Saccharopolyspora taberi TaxID=60895 RepID=A0ABN3VG27_9PSEU